MSTNHKSADLIAEVDEELNNRLASASEILGLETDPASPDPEVLALTRRQLDHDKKEGSIDPRIARGVRRKLFELEVAAAQPQQKPLHFEEPTYEESTHESQSAKTTRSGSFSSDTTLQGDDVSPRSTVPPDAAQRLPFTVSKARNRAQPRPRARQIPKALPFHGASGGRHASVPEVRKDDRGLGIWEANMPKTSYPLGYGPFARMFGSELKHAPFSRQHAAYQRETQDQAFIRTDDGVNIPSNLIPIIALLTKNKAPSQDEMIAYLRHFQENGAAVSAASPERVFGQRAFTADIRLADGPLFVDDDVNALELIKKTDQNSGTGLRALCGSLRFQLPLIHPSLDELQQIAKRVKAPTINELKTGADAYDFHEHELAQVLEIWGKQKVGRKICLGVRDRMSGRNVVVNSPNDDEEVQVIWIDCDVNRHWSGLRPRSIAETEPETWARSLLREFYNFFAYNPDSLEPLVTYHQFQVTYPWFHLRRAIAKGGKSVLNGGKAVVNGGRLILQWIARIIAAFRDVLGKGWEVLKDLYYAVKQWLHQAQQWVGQKLTDTRDTIAATAIEQWSRARLLAQRTQASIVSASNAIRQQAHAGWQWICMKAYDGCQGLKNALAALWACVCLIATGLQNLVVMLYQELLNVPNRLWAVTKWLVDPTTCAWLIPFIGFLLALWGCGLLNLIQEWIENTLAPSAAELTDLSLTALHQLVLALMGSIMSLTTVLWERFWGPGLLWRNLKWACGRFYHLLKMSTNYVFDTISYLLNAISHLPSTIFGFLLEFAQGCLNFFRCLATIVGILLRAFWENICAGLWSVLAFISSGFSNILALISASFRAVLTSISAGFRTILTWLSNVVQIIANRFALALRSIKTTLVRMKRAFNQTSWKQALNWLMRHLLHWLFIATAIAFGVWLALWYCGWCGSCIAAVNADKGYCASPSNTIETRCEDAATSLWSRFEDSISSLWTRQDKTHRDIEEILQELRHPGTKPLLHTWWPW